jgi:starch synthase (maltosyl-transferring)
MTRLVLAATLSANYGIYGPAFELMEHVPLKPGSEEYRDSEKYQIREWNLERADTLAPFIERINQIRRSHAALRRDDTLVWLDVDNEQLLAYAKVSADGQDVIVVVTNLDYYNVQSGWLELPLTQLGIDAAQPYQMDDLLGGDSYQWHGPRNFVRLDPYSVASHIFHVRPQQRAEQRLEKFA